MSRIASGGSSTKRYMANAKDCEGSEAFSVSDRPLPCAGMIQIRFKGSRTDPYLSPVARAPLVVHSYSLLMLSCYTLWTFVAAPVLSVAGPEPLGQETGVGGRRSNHAKEEEAKEPDEGTWTLHMSVVQRLFWTNVVWSTKRWLWMIYATGGSAGSRALS